MHRSITMNAINWFEIPAIDFDRAVKFYESALGINMHRELFAGDPNAFFPYTQGQGVGGALVKAEYAKPNADGAIVYLNAGTREQLDAALARVESAGGTVLQPTTDMGEIGVTAYIRDTEGNRVGLHAWPESRN
jgi:predicted enzyme related to lactoylglutathione lyase